MSYTNDLVVATAQLLAAQVPILRWRPTAAYTANEVGVFIRVVPPDPDRIVVLTPYPVTDDLSQSDSVMGLQVRTRAPVGAPSDVDADGLADSVFDVLQGNTWPHPSGKVIICQHQSGTPLGTDQSGRIERTDNYYLSVYRPSAHRL